LVVSVFDMIEQLTTTYTEILTKALQ